MILEYNGEELMIEEEGTRIFLSKAEAKDLLKFLNKQFTIGLGDYVITNIPKYKDNEPDGYVEGYVSYMELQNDKTTIHYKVEHNFNCYHWFTVEQLTKIP